MQIRIADRQIPELASRPTPKMNTLPAGGHSMILFTQESLLEARNNHESMKTSRTHILVQGIRLIEVQDVNASAERRDRQCDSAVRPVR